MKINDIEIDIQKVVELYEKELRINKKNQQKTNEKIKEWWNSEPGMIQREIQSQIMRNRYCHRQKLKYELINEDGEIININGQDELAHFLGYKKFNNDLRKRMSSGTIADITRKKIYEIKEIL